MGPESEDVPASGGGAVTHLSAMASHTRPEQQSPSLRHHAPAVTQAHFPPLHESPPQHSVPSAQVLPAALQHDGPPYGGLPL